MEPKQQPASLRDVLPQGYDHEDYFSDSELQWIRSTFRDPKAVNIIRKVFIPTVHDGALPIEEMAKDMWMTGVDFAQYADSHAKTLIVARQEMIKFVMGALVRLKVIATMKQESEIEEKARLAKNSVK